MVAPAAFPLSSAQIRIQTDGGATVHRPTGGTALHLLRPGSTTIPTEGEGHPPDKPRDVRGGARSIRPSRRALLVLAGSRGIGVQPCAVTSSRSGFPGALVGPGDRAPVSRLGGGHDATRSSRVLLKLLRPGD